MTARPRRPSPRLAVGLLLLIAVVAAAAVASIAVGARPIAVTDVWTALVAPTGSDDDVVVRALRLPRTGLALVVGVALGVAGALIQGHTRNPLADPGLLGVSAGAAFAVCLAIYALGVTDVGDYVWFAFAGALVASSVVFLLGALSPSAAAPVTLVLAGAAVTAFLAALTSALVLLDASTLDAYRFWVVGSVSGRSAEVLAQVAPFLLAGLVVAALNIPALNTLSLGEDVARGLGQHVGVARGTGVLAITVLTGAAVAATGPIAFLGLVVPHLARAVTGPDYRWLVPYAGLLGAAVLLVADVVGRLVVRPGELQVGIVLAFVGAPFFLAVARRRRLVAL